MPSSLQKKVRVRFGRCIDQLVMLAHEAPEGDRDRMQAVLDLAHKAADSAHALLADETPAAARGGKRGTPPAPPPAAAVAAARAAINTSSVQPPGAASAAGRELMDTADALPFRALGAGEPTAQEWIDGIAAETLGTAYEHDAWLWMTAGDGQKLWGMLKTAAEKLEWLRKKARDLEAADDTNY